MTLVIVGGGISASHLAKTLRALGAEMRIQILCDEALLPYQRPPLSKGFLQDEGPVEDLLVLSEADYQTQGIEVLTGARVTEIDRAASEVLLQDGRRLPYDQLVLATGARARVLGAGEGLPGLISLRDYNDALTLRAQLPQAREIIVVGGGLIGLELAGVVCKAGKQVRVLEAGPRLLGRAVSASTAAEVQSQLEAQGIEILTGVAIEAITEAAGRLVVELKDQTRLTADLMISAIGILPNTELAEAAGLSVRNGIEVDASLCSSDAAIFALGDCASVLDPLSGQHQRFETIKSCYMQAETLAAHLARQPAAQSAELPGFSSKQGSLSLHVVGGNRQAGEAVRLEIPKPGFCTLILQDGLLVGAEILNNFKLLRSLSGMVAAGLRLSAQDIANAADPVQRLNEIYAAQQAAR